MCVQIPWLTPCSYCRGVFPSHGAQRLPLACLCGKNSSKCAFPFALFLPAVRKPLPDGTMSVRRVCSQCYEILQRQSLNPSGENIMFAPDSKPFKQETLVVMNKLKPTWCKHHLKTSLTEPQHNKWGLINMHKNTGKNLIIHLHAELCVSHWGCWHKTTSAYVTSFTVLASLRLDEGAASLDPFSLTSE